MQAMAKQSQAKTPVPQAKPAKPVDHGEIHPEHNPVWQSLALGPRAIQAKLTVSQPDDPYEREADRVADQVMRMAVPSFNNASGIVQRQCSSCEEEEQKVQRKEESDTTDSPIVDQSMMHGVLSSSGQPLDPVTRSFMEDRFSHDFSRVRVHADDNAAALAWQLNARAYTTGNHIGFGAGRYEPATERGQRLLAHELTHVVQQSGNQAGPTIQRDEERFCPNGEVNDAQVQSLINSAITFATTRGRTDLNVAFARLRNARENNCCDLNLAAAEHYMWARLQVATGAWSFFEIALIIAYSFAKFLHLVPRTGDCPITRASAAQIRWATQGAVDGEMDYYSTPP